MAPDSPATSAENDDSISWWVWPIPVGLTIVIVGVAAAILISKEGGFYQTLSGLSLNALGDFVGGVGGALAFVWLVFGYFLQSRELRLQREELHLQRKNTAELAEATGASEQHARRDTLFRTMDFSLPELAELSHLIWLDTFGASSGGRKQDSEVLKPQFDAGDRWIYCRDIGRYFVGDNPGGPARVRQSLKDEPRLQEHIRSYLAAHRILTELAEEVDMAWVLRQPTALADTLREYVAD